MIVGAIITVFELCLNSSKEWENKRLGEIQTDFFTSARLPSKENNRLGRKKIKTKNILLFIGFQLIFCPLLAVCLVFYGPFTGIREAYVTTAMTTLSHQYLATTFISKGEIDRIMKKNQLNMVIPELQNPADGNSPSLPAFGESASDSIELVKFNTNRYRGYMLIVSDPSRISVATAENLGKSGMTLSEIVKTNDAIGGINAGGFIDDGLTGTGAIPTGLIVKNHEVLNPSESGVLIGFNDQHQLVVGTYKLNNLEALGIRDAISFTPPMVLEGKPMITEGDGGWGIGPRTAIGQRKDGTVLLLVIDGRQKDSIGATVREAMNIMLEYGAYTAANLDGGSSTTMYYDGKVVSSPSDILGERAIPSAFIIK